MKKKKIFAGLAYYTPLRERNWAVMIMTFLTLLLTGLAAVLLWSTVISTNADLWVWITACVMTLASFISIVGLISGDVEWTLIAILVSRQR